MPGSESVDCKVLGKKWPLMVLFNFFLGGKNIFYLTDNFKVQSHKIKVYLNHIKGDFIL